MTSGSCIATSGSEGAHSRVGEEGGGLLIERETRGGVPYYMTNLEKINGFETVLSTKFR